MDPGFRKYSNRLDCSSVEECLSLMGPIPNIARLIFLKRSFKKILLVVLFLSFK